MLKGVYLSLFMGPMVPVPAPKAVVDALISAQVNTGGERSGFQLVFSMNKKSTLRQTLLPAGFALAVSTRFIGGLGAHGLKIQDVVLGKAKVRRAA